MNNNKNRKKAKGPKNNKNKKIITHLMTMPQAAGKKILKKLSKLELKIRQIASNGIVKLKKCRQSICMMGKSKRQYYKVSFFQFYLPKIEFMASVLIFQLPMCCKNCVDSFSREKCVFSHIFTKTKGSFLAKKNSRRCWSQLEI